jgi:two-component system chemotaxis response regulator CheY
MSKTILAVDDSAAMRQILQAVLADAGYRVTVAADGANALTLARDNTFDLVLTDQHMPGVAGLDLIAALRNLDAYTHTPILVLTTESGDDFKAAARDAGATGWLAKPIDTGTLTELVHVLVTTEKTA